MTSTALLPIGAALMATFMAVSVAAQGNPAATQVAKEVQTVTIVGCLVQGDPTAARGDRVPTGSASSASFFVRTPTLAVPAGGTVAVGKRGTSTSTSSGTPTSDSFYRITGLDDEQLRPHIGHRVEVRGQLGTSTSGKSASAKTTVDSSGRATTTVETRPVIAGSVHATTIKMVSESCS